jgi:hypothetical protein
MNCEKRKELLAGWMDNQLTDAERAEMDAHLAICVECRQELETNRRLWASMGEIVTPEPSDKMQVRFDAMLDTYRQEQTNRRPGIFFYLRQLFAVRPGFTWAYSVGVLVLGLGLGYVLSRAAAGASGSGSGVGAGSEVVAGSGAGTGGTSVVGLVADSGAGTGAGTDKQQLQALSTQVREMREMILLALLENPSASERMRGVSYTSEIKGVNKNVVDALLSTLNNDPNSNVRLITLEALTHYAEDPVVREGLVQSILHQDSPLVQAALADVMLKLQEKKAVRPLKELLQQKGLNEMVRNKIEQTLTRLI